MKKKLHNNILINKHQGNLKIYFLLLLTLSLLLVTLSGIIIANITSPRSIGFSDDIDPNNKDELNNKIIIYPGQKITFIIDIKDNEKTIEKLSIAFLLFNGKDKLLLKENTTFQITKSYVVIKYEPHQPGLIKVLLVNYSNNKYNYSFKIIFDGVPNYLYHYLLIEFLVVSILIIIYYLKEINYYNKTLKQLENAVKTQASKKTLFQRKNRKNIIWVYKNYFSYVFTSLPLFYFSMFYVLIISFSYIDFKNFKFNSSLYLTNFSGDLKNLFVFSSTFLERSFSVESQVFYLVFIKFFYPFFIIILIFHILLNQNLRNSAKKNIALEKTVITIRETSRVIIKSLVFSVVIFSYLIPLWLEDIYFEKRVVENSFDFIAIICSALIIFIGLFTFELLLHFFYSLDYRFGDIVIGYVLIDSFISLLFLRIVFPLPIFSYFMKGQILVSNFFNSTENYFILKDVSWINIISPLFIYPLVIIIVHFVIKDIILKKEVFWRLVKGVFSGRTRTSR